MIGRDFFYVECMPIGWHDGQMQAVSTLYALYGTPMAMVDSVDHWWDSDGKLAHSWSRC